MHFRGIGPHLTAKESHIVFLKLWRQPVYVLELEPEWPFKTRVGSATSGLLSSCEGHLVILLEAWQDNGYASRFEVGDQVSLCSCQCDTVTHVSFPKDSAFGSF